MSAQARLGSATNTLVTSDRVASDRPDDPVVLRGGTLVDGTGGAARPADVEIVGDRIGRVGDVPAGTGTDVDVSGLVIAPGFIDVHTHYDAQILWDRDLTPSCWHGVTTVIMGNCGFGVAPARPSDRADLVSILENVEGMSAAALTAGIEWTFEDFPDYLDTVEAGGVRLNVGVMVGHTPLRLYVMGEDADTRAATADEIAAMRTVLARALAAGAIGFASSRGAAHLGRRGRPVPSRFAEVAELSALADTVGEAGHGILQIITGPDLSPEFYAETSVRTGRPVTWLGLATGLGPSRRVIDVLDAVRDLPGDVWPQVACQPIVMQITPAEPFAFGLIGAFADVIGAQPAARAAVYADPAWRARARADADAHRPVTARWAKTFVAESDAAPELIDRSLADIAGERGTHPVDVLADVSLADGLRTRFRVVLGNDDEDELSQVLGRRDTLLGLSDAGAHASQLCDAGFGGRLLSYWVRDRKALSLETAVWRLTGHPAAVFQLTGRGVVAPSNVADLVAFDPGTVGVGPLQRVHDLPAGSDRLITHSLGIHHVWVSGTAIRRDGADLDGVRPGRLLRGGRD